MTTRFDRGQWAHSGAQTVRPGVHRVPLPLPNDGLRAVNVYVLEEGGRLVLIDGGWAVPESRKALENALAGLGHDLGEITDILVTHIHRDHYTQAVELRRLLGSRVHLGAGERDGLMLTRVLPTEEPYGALHTLRRGGAAQLADRIEALGRESFDASVWEEPDCWLTAGELRFGDLALRVIPTPGHTRGHVVFLDASRGLLFSGDHVLPHITPSIGFELGEPDLPLGHYLASLQLMTTLADARLLPAHGPVGESVHTRVAELLAHHDTRLAETLAVLGDEPRTPFTVATHLTWTRRHTPFEALDLFNRMLAVNETTAHLDVLVARGRAARQETDGVTWYTAAAGTA